MKKEQNKAEHKESFIDDMHVLVSPLGTVAGMLYYIFASDCVSNVQLSSLFQSTAAILHTRYASFSPVNPPHIIANPDRNQIEVDSLKPVPNRFDWKARIRFNLDGIRI